MSVAVDVRHTAGKFHLHARFALPEPGIAVLFGPSGAGKSLTLSLIAGLHRPHQGCVELHGRTVDDVAHGVHVRPQDRRIGMVFQDALLRPHRTVLDNVALAVRGRRPRDERRRLAARALDAVGAGDLAHARPRTLSGGQRQRVALARALAGEPQLLLLDEPFSALDRPVRRELRALLRGLAGERALPVLLVTHDHEELVELADHAVLFDPGSVRAVVPAERLGDVMPELAQRERG